MAAPEQALHLYYSEGSCANPYPLTYFFFISLKDKSRTASPQSQVTRQDFQQQKPPLQKRTLSAGSYMDHQAKAQLSSVDATQTPTTLSRYFSSLEDCRHYLSRNVCPRTIQ